MSHTHTIHTYIHIYMFMTFVCTYVYICEMYKIHMIFVYRHRCRYRYRDPFGSRYRYRYYAVPYGSYVRRYDTRYAKYYKVLANVHQIYKNIVSARPKPTFLKKVVSLKKKETKKEPAAACSAVSGAWGYQSMLNSNKMNIIMIIIPYWY